MDGRDYTLLAAGATVGIIGLKLTTTGMMRAEGEEIASCVQCEKDKAEFLLEHKIDKYDTHIREKMGTKGRHITAEGKTAWNRERESLRRKEQTLATYKSKIEKWFVGTGRSEMWEDVEAKTPPSDKEVPAGEERIPDVVTDWLGNVDISDAQVPPEVTEGTPEPELTKEKMVKAGLWQQFVDFFTRK
jgi:hypothetical protein